MTNKDMPDLRKLAANEDAIIYTKHGHAKMLERGYTTEDVSKILTSPTNQLIEKQASGDGHLDERYVISDPQYHPDTAVLIALIMSNPAKPRILIVTVEQALDIVWRKDKATNPWLTRIGVMK